MANPDPSKTEDPTGKKLADSRNDGDIPISQDMTSVSSLMTATIMLIFFAPQLMESFSKVFLFSFSLSTLSDWTSKDLQAGTMAGMEFFANSYFIIIFGIVVASLVSIRSQVGAFFNTKPLQWKFNSLNPANGFKQLLPDKQKLFKFGMTMCKVITITVVCYFIIKDDMPMIMQIALVPVITGTIIMLKLTMKLTLIVLTIFIIISIIDVLWKRKSHKEKLMMTKDEVKDERKNMDGDPKIKSKIRAKMRQMAMENIMTGVRDADVIVTNPTHVAVALSYKSGEGAPKVIAKGLRKKALRIKEIAKDAGIPIVEAPPLARSLYRNTETGAYIDEQFFSAVAVILAKILRRKKKRVNA